MAMAVWFDTEKSRIRDMQRSFNQQISTMEVRIRRLEAEIVELRKRLEENKS